eukprot:jgi/Chlat1/5967/Chrsp4S06180
MTSSSVKEFWVAVAINAGFFVAIITAFLLLRRIPATAPIYNRRVPHDAAACDRTWFGWLSCALRASEGELMQNEGLDALMFLRFFRMAFVLLLGYSLFCLPVILPINISGNYLSTSKAANTSGMDKLTFSNIPPKSSFLWAHTVAGWLVSIWTWLVLYKYYTDYADLRERVKTTDLTTDQEHTVVVTDMPGQLPGTRGNPERVPQDSAPQFFGKVYPTEFFTARTIVDMREVEAVYAKRAHYIKALDRVQQELEELAAKSKDPATLQCVDAHDTQQLQRTAYTAPADALDLELGQPAKPEPEEEKSGRSDVPEDSDGAVEIDKQEKAAAVDRPVCRAGFQGLWGPQVDAMQFYEQQIQALTKELEAEQTRAILVHRTPSAVVTFKSRTAAAFASQTLHCNDGLFWRVAQAPEPRDIYFRRFRKRYPELQVRQVVTTGVVTVFVLFFFTIIVVIAGLTNPDELSRRGKFWQNLLDAPFIGSVLRTLLASWVLIVLLLLVPRLALLLARWQCPDSQASKQSALVHMSEMQWVAFKMFYAVLFWDVFIGYTLSGTLVSEILNIVDNPSKLVTILGSSIPGASSYFVTFMMTRTFTFMPLDLLQPWPLIVTAVTTLVVSGRFVYRHTGARLLRPSTTDKLVNKPVKGQNNRRWKPFQIEYHIHGPNHLKMLSLGLNFSIIAPIILPFSLLYFLIGYIIWRNAVAHCREPLFESGGNIWPLIHNNMLVALVVQQIVLIGMFSLKLSVAQTPFLIPLPILSIVFWLLTRQRLRNAALYVSVNNARMADYEASKTDLSPDWPTNIAAAYVPACMSGSLYDPRIGRRRTEGEDVSKQSSNDASLQQERQQQSNPLDMPSAQPATGWKAVRKRAAIVAQLKALHQGIGTGSGVATAAAADAGEGSAQETPSVYNSAFNTNESSPSTADAGLESPTDQKRL